VQEKRQNQNQMIQNKRQSSVSSTTLEISTKIMFLTEIMTISSNSLSQIKFSNGWKITP